MIHSISVMVSCKIYNTYLIFFSIRYIMVVISYGTQEGVFPDKIGGYFMENNMNRKWLNTPDPQIFVKNAAKYNDLMMMYRCTIREIQTKLEVLNDEFSVEYKRNPISFIKTRIKSPESIYRKFKTARTTPRKHSGQAQRCSRSPCSMHLSMIFIPWQIFLPIRMILPFSVKDYIKNPKPNGGRSYHMIVEIPVFPRANANACRGSDPHQREWISGRL